MDSETLLISLAIICFCLFFVRTMMIAYRFYMLKHLKEGNQLEQARQQMEISIANNSTTNTSNNSGNGIARSHDDNDMTILPKGMDLPPSYDELNISNNNVKQEDNIGASTLTITTELECSNPNLAAALNEPPPDYEHGVLNSSPPRTTTVSTSTVVCVTPRV